MENKIWVYIDHFRGQVSPFSWEALGAGLALADTYSSGVSAVLFGSQVEALAAQAFAYGAAEVLLADDPTLLDFRAEAYASLLSAQAAASKPEVVIFPTTTRCRELAAMAAVDLQTGVLPDVIAMEVQNRAVLATRPVYAGKLLAKVACTARPQLITVRARSYASPQAQPGKDGPVTRLTPSLAEADIPTRIESYAPAEAAVSLTDAAVVVSGGRGVANNPKLQPPAGLDEKAAEIWRAQRGFEMLGELASVLGAALGASRAAVDAGYIAYTHQVGQTGKLVSPDLYIACGISGAIQHLAGMRTSKVIVAINKDPDAPIFKLARYGIVGDLYEIVPALTAAFRQRLAP
jgi:electron transfer flavoprotein alpha subunit